MIARSCFKAGRLLFIWREWT